MKASKLGIFAVALICTIFAPRASAADGESKPDVLSTAAAGYAVMGDGYRAANQALRAKKLEAKIQQKEKVSKYATGSALENEMRDISQLKTEMELNRKFSRRVSLAGYAGLTYLVGEGIYGFHLLDPVKKHDNSAKVNEAAEKSKSKITPPEPSPDRPDTYGGKNYITGIAQ